MLQGQLYDIVSQEGASFELCFHADHPIYKAHFPDNPITPGVCFMQIAQDLFSSVSLLPIKSAIVTSLKLLSVHTPNQSAHVHFEINEQNKLQVNFETEDKRLISILKFIVLNDN